MNVAIELQKAAPKKAREIEKEALAVVVARAKEVDQIASARERAAPPALKAPRNAVVASWSALHGGLGVVATLPASAGSEGPTAERLALSLFPEGMSFSNGDAAAVWVHSERLLGRIEAEGLVAPLETLLHPALLAAVRRAHAELGTATGLSAKVTSPASTASLAEACSRFAFAVTAYARALSIGIDDRDQVAAARFARMLAPIDAYRVGVSKPEEDDEPSEPAAPVPTGGPGGPTPPPFG